MSKPGYVYILTNQRNGTLYIGVTSDPIGRIYQHRTSVTGGFTAKHGATRLVYFEVHDDIGMAIAREKQLKKWRRRWKLELIERDNPEWRDLWPDIAGKGPEDP